MSAERQELQEALRRYTGDTLSDINTLRGFCERNSSWMDARKSELTIVKHIKEKQSGKKAELEKELVAVLKDTLRGLEELNCFLDAVEKLAVTSLHVFMEGNQVLHLPKGISPQQVQLVIIAARLICPLLLQFKRDASVFFLPRLQNIEVLSYQLEKYIQTTQKICEMFEKSSISEISLEMMETVVDLSVDLSEDDVQKMLQHIYQLHDIRMNQNFRMVFLFQEVSCSGFISEFTERQPGMLEFLNQLEESAVQLDRMNKGAKISSVTGSSVGAIGGVLSIIGLALIPVTAGVSLALTMTGVGMGIASGANSLVTTATEIGVNRTQQKKASGVFESFMEDVKSVQDRLEEVTNQIVTKIEGSEILDVAVGVGKVLGKLGAVGKGIDSLVDVVSALKLLRSEELIASAGKVVAQEGQAIGRVSRVAADLPDVGQAAVKGSLALSKSARAGFIALNALFLGMDIFFICKDSINLYKGSETKISQFIRARAALWSSEINSWKKIHDSLCEGLKTSEKKQILMDTSFYPEKEMNEGLKTSEGHSEVLEERFDLSMDKQKSKCCLCRIFFCRK